MSSSSSSPSPSSSLPSLPSELSSLFSVRSKTVLLTGGGSGIGLMFASALVSSGARVFISSRSLTTLTSSAAELNTKGPGSCIPIAADLEKMEGIEKLMKTLKEEYKLEKLDVLVNNSGFSWGEPYEKFREIGWDRVMDLNVKSLFFLTQKLTPLLAAAGTAADPARVINIGSIAGLHHQHVPTYSYDVSKAAVHHLTRKLASELASQNITVNAIAPGFVPTKMSKGLRMTPEQLKKIIPLGRPGAPTDMAGVLLFLCGQAGSWITGVVIPVDGGALVASKL